MKSSPYRKRYILVYSDNLQSRIKHIDSDLYRVFRARRKYIRGNYAIFRTNQYYRDQFIEYVKNEMPGVETITTSGSMKKCKEAITARKDTQIIGANL